MTIASVIEVPKQIQTPMVHLALVVRFLVKNINQFKELFFYEGFNWRSRRGLIDLYRYCCYIMH